MIIYLVITIWVVWEQWHFQDINKSTSWKAIEVLCIFPKFREDTNKRIIWKVVRACCTFQSSGRGWFGLHVPPCLVLGSARATWFMQGKSTTVHCRMRSRNSSHASNRKCTKKWSIGEDKQMQHISIESSSAISNHFSTSSPDVSATNWIIGKWFNKGLAKNILLFYRSSRLKIR